MDSDNESDDNFDVFCKCTDKNKDARKTKVSPSDFVSQNPIDEKNNRKDRAKLSILKEKAKQNYFVALHELHSKYDVNNCDSEDMEEMTINLRNDFDTLNSFLDDEYAANMINGREKPKVNESAKAKVRKRLSYNKDTPELDMSGFSRGCRDQPQGTALKKQQIRSGIQLPTDDRGAQGGCEAQPGTSHGKPTADLNSGSATQKPFRSNQRVCKTPAGKPTQLNTVSEVDENVGSPIGKFLNNDIPRAPRRTITTSKITKYKPQAASTPLFPKCSAPRDLSLSTKKLPRKSMDKPSTSAGTVLPTTSDGTVKNEGARKKPFTGLLFKPKLKPITEHNLSMYKKRAQNEFTKKVTHAKRTISVDRRTAVIDNLKKDLDSKLKRIDKLPQLQKDIDIKYADDVRKVTEQLHDWTDGRNSELNSLKRNYELRTAQLVKDFEVADLEEIPKAREKMKLKIPQYNLDEYRERARADVKKKADHAKKNIPVSERNAFMCIVQKELELKLQRIEKIPELAKNLEAKYNEAVKNNENQFGDDEELLQEQLEFLKEEYDAKMANLDEDSVMPACIRGTGLKGPLITNKAFDCKRLYEKIGPVLELNELPKPCGSVIMQKDQILADLEKARKSNKTKKQVLTATSKPSTSQKVPSRAIQETIRSDKNLAKKQLIEAARNRAKNMHKQIKNESEQLPPPLPAAATSNPMRKEAAEDIFHMMLLEHEAVDMSKPPKDILEVLTKIDTPKLEIVGNAFELDDNEIVPILIPTRELNQLSEVQEEEILIALKIKQHPAPKDGLAAEMLADKQPPKIELNKNPDYDPISIPVYLNSYKYEDMFQVRGTTFPKWFPGFYACGPHENAPQIILRESPSEILAAAWIGMKPRRIY